MSIEYLKNKIYKKKVVSSLYNLTCHFWKYVTFDSFLLVHFSFLLWLIGFHANKLEQFVKKVRFTDITRSDQVFINQIISYILSKELKNFFLQDFNFFFFFNFPCLYNIMVISLISLFLLSLINC